MANPQKEDGHVDIANEIAEHFAILNLSPYEWRILWVILRKTYGWNKKSDHISLSQFAKLTNIPSQHVVRTISQLLDKNIIVKNNGSLVKEYGFQKDYEKWGTLPTQVVPSKVVPIQAVPEQVIPDKVLPAEAIGTTSTGTPLETKGTPSGGSHNKHINNNIQITYIEPNLGEFTNVKITQEEYTKLINKFGKDIADDKIEVLSGYIASSGKKYSSHYATILTWDRKDKRDKASRFATNNITPAKTQYKPVGEI